MHIYLDVAKGRLSCLSAAAVSVQVELTFPDVVSLTVHAHLDFKTCKASQQAYKILATATSEILPCLQLVSMVWLSEMCRCTPKVEVVERGPDRYHIRKFRQRKAWFAGSHGNVSLKLIVNSQTSIWFCQ